LPPPAPGSRAAAELRLEVRDYAGPTRWRWVLADAAGEVITGHAVQLDQASWQYEALGDLPGYLSWQAAPDQRAEDEARIAAELGGWISAEVLGPVAPALAGSSPATVRVLLPPGAEALAFHPLELAHVNGKPLAAQDVTLVIETGAGTGRRDQPAATGEPKRLRLLGLFSLPEGGRALNLRRERDSLVTLIRGKAADVRVLQYGVTRDRLRDVLAEPAGWDVIHISGHGAPGELLLETAAGQPDWVTAADLAGLLELARERVQLVTISACWSAALTVAEQRRLLGLPVQAQPAERRPPSHDAWSGPGTLATGLATSLGCAVLAMRYPVPDEFAIDLAGTLYDLLLGQGQPLPRALGITLRQLSESGNPALAVATPALFGGRATGLRLAVPARRTGDTGPDVAEPAVAGFPPQPERFVGRTAVMARASAALAAASGIPGVLLHGMPGGGKTACALELAYGYQDAFDHLAWYKAPDEGGAIDGTLTDFAFALERSWPGFQMAHLVASPDGLARFLPQLTQQMERSRLLIVLDNAESLLADDDAWREERWGQVIAALTSHTGPGRLVLTSRRVPSSGVSGLAVLPVDELSADESLLLARELPNLRKLSLGQVPGIERPVALRLARRALTLARGNPKLLELADGQAAHPERLADLVDAGDQAWREQGGLPDGFFAADAADGARAAASDYLHVLATWTQLVSGKLTVGERCLFWFLCCLEEPDRIRSVLDGSWTGLWHRLGGDGQPLGLDQALTAIATQALAEIRPATQDASERYAIHPGVAAAGREHAGPPFRYAADAEAALYWTGVYEDASGTEGGGSLDTRRVVQAGIAAAPYLSRVGQWTAAANLLDEAFLRDPSRANAVALLPAIQQAGRHDPKAAGVAAKILEELDPVAAEAWHRTQLDAAVSAGDYRSASVTAERLVILCRRSGRLAEALGLVDQMIGYTRQAGLGPWTQLYDQVMRLQVLAQMGHADQVLAEVERLRAYMDTLPAAADRPGESVPSWRVRESVLGTGHSAALRLRKWADALDLNAAVVASLLDRDAPAADVARERFGDYGPLIELRRLDEALALLLDCRQVFQDSRDTEMLGKVLTALAAVEQHRGRGASAVRFQRDALRYKYLAGDVASIAVSYNNLGTHLHAGQPVQALASHLAAALIDTLTGSGDYQGAIPGAAADLRELGPSAVPPTGVADLDRQVGEIPGTDLPGLIAALSHDAETAERTLRELSARARALAERNPA
jgi:CHAT domain